MKILITKEAEQAIRAAATLPFAPGSEPIPGPDGFVTIDIERETFDRLIQTRFPQETLSDCILRLFAHYKGSVQ